jgi:Peptidase propeptide and YPEB domain
MIERDQAIEIAKERALQKDWAFVEPLEVIIRRNWFGNIKHFEIETNAGNLGTKARFIIDAKTGKITSEGYIAR